jgi:hypothetical protein
MRWMRVMRKERKRMVDETYPGPAWVEEGVSQSRPGMTAQRDFLQTIVLTPLFPIRSLNSIV